MQAVVDFLLEYYIWVLAVLVILLITVIGFLADTKRKKKMRENSMVTQQNDGNGMNNTNDFNNMGQNMNMDYNMNQNNGTYGNMNQNGGNVFEPNVNSGFNNNMLSQGANGFNVQGNAFLGDGSNSVQANVNNNDSFFVSASEQTPRFEPQNVEIPSPAISPEPVNSNGIFNQSPVVDTIQPSPIPTPVVEPIPVSPVQTQVVQPLSPINLEPSMPSKQSLYTQPVNSSAVVSPVSSVPNVPNMEPSAIAPKPVPTASAAFGINDVQVNNVAPNMAPNYVPNNNVLNNNFVQNGTSFVTGTPQQAPVPNQNNNN